MAKTAHPASGIGSHETLQFLTLFGDAENPEYELSFPNEISSFHYHSSIYPIYYYLKTKIEIDLFNSFRDPLVDRKLLFEELVPYSLGFSVARVNYSAGEPWDSIIRGDKFPTPITMLIASTAPDTEKGEKSDTAKTISRLYSRESIPMKVGREIETDVFYRVILGDVEFNKAAVMRVTYGTQMNTLSLEDFVAYLFSDKSVYYLEESDSKLEISDVVIGKRTYIDTLTEYLPMFMSSTNSEPIMIFYNQDIDRLQVGTFSAVYDWAAEEKGERILYISGSGVHEDFEIESLRGSYTNIFSPEISDGIVQMNWVSFPAYSHYTQWYRILNTKDDDMITGVMYRRSNISPILEKANLQEESLCVTTGREKFLASAQAEDLVKYELWLLNQVATKGIIKARVRATDPLVYHPPSAVIVVQQNQQIAWKSLVFSIDILSGKSVRGANPATFLELGIIPLEKIELL